MFPTTWESPEGKAVAECFKARRHATVSTVEAVHEFRSSKGVQVSLEVSSRFRRGGNTWFSLPPLANPVYNHPINLDWTRLEVGSPAMRETIEWLVLYLCLGWEILRGDPSPACGSPHTSGRPS